MSWDYLVNAISNIHNKGVRSWLTMTGIFIGIAAVVSLISLGQGLNEALIGQFEAMGSDIIFVLPGTGFGGPPGSEGTFDDHDLKLVRDTLGVEEVLPMVTKLARVEFGDEVKYPFVSGMPPKELVSIFGNLPTFQAETGRQLRPTDRYKVLVGNMFASGDVFEKKVKVGDKLIIEGQKFKIIGIITPIGNPEDDSQVIMPLEPAQEIFKTEEFAAFMVRSKEAFDVEKVSDTIQKRMRDDRDQDPGEENFLVQSSASLMDTVGGVLDVVNYVLFGIAGISLVVGGVGIMNTMYTSVLERTNEIGVMKAIGARNSDILKIFMIESGLLGLVGGAIGVVLGLAMSKTVEYGAAAANWEILQASVSAELIIGAMAFSCIVGTLSGVLPARQASKLKPVDALRYE